MRETFEEVYYAFADVIEHMGDLGKIIGKALIRFTVPFWIIPYAIIRRINHES